jgi:transcriptional regulator with XRE-family HTH domain
MVDVAAAERGIWEPIVGAIGPKVRDARQQLGLSLQQLSGRADVSAAAIHKVERGDMVPTITTLLKLAGALGMPIGHFVDEGGPPVRVATLIRADKRPEPPPEWAPAADGVVGGSVAHPMGLLRAAGVMGVVEPGGGSGELRALRPGEEVLLVLEGTLQVDVAGEDYRLHPGDALHYPTDRPHEWRNADPVPARAVWFTVRT